MRWRWRFRFSLRMILCLVIPIAAISMWGSQQVARARQQASLVAWVQQQRGHYRYDYQQISSPSRSQVSPPGPAWIRNWLGVDYLARVESVVLDNQEVEDFSVLTTQSDLLHLAIMIDILPSADLRELAALKRLQSLSLNYTEIDRQQWAAIQQALPECKCILGDSVTFR